MIDEVIDIEAIDNDRIVISIVEEMHEGAKRGCVVARRGLAMTKTAWLAFGYRWLACEWALKCQILLPDVPQTHIGFLLAKHDDYKGTLG